MGYPSYTTDSEEGIDWMITICSDLLCHIQTQLEEALLTLGQFQQAFDELWAWLTALHEQLSDPEPISGKIDTVNTLITKHTVR